MQTICCLPVMDLGDVISIAKFFNNITNLMKRFDSV